MNAVTVESVKREAKAISRATSISHSQALDVLAVQAGHSHWGSYQSAIVEDLRLAAERRDRTISPMDLLAEIIGRHDYLPPSIREARHMVVSGGTSTGKTTLLNRLLGFVPARSPIAVLEGYPEMPNPAPGRAAMMPLGPRAGHEEWLSAYRAASAAGAGTVVFGEISVLNGRAALEAIKTPHGPTILSCIHATSPSEAAEVMFDRSGGGEVQPEDGIMCVQMARDMTGRRSVVEVTLLERTQRPRHPW